MAWDRLLESLTILWWDLSSNQLVMFVSNSNNEAFQMVPNAVKLSDGLVSHTAKT